MPKPACPKCHLFFRPKKNDVIVDECAPMFNGAEAGDPSQWKTYKVWSADLWECRGCGAQVVVGYGSRPISEHYQDSHTAWKERVDIRIEDC